MNRSFTKIDSILKTLQVQANPPEGLVQAYLIHIGDKSDTNFRKILDLKGIRKQDQPNLVDLFRVFVRSREEAGDTGRDEGKLVDQSTILSPLLIQSSNIAPSSTISNNIGGVNANSAGLHGQMNRFDPRDFGSALINAARDGVDRLQTPGLMSLADRSGSDSGSVLANVTSGVSGLGIAIGSDSGSSVSGDKRDDNINNNIQTPSSAGTPLNSERGNALNLGEGNSSSNLNENLRNLGRFFRRETGRFGS